MKSSPLRLKLVTYPSASYEVRDDFEADEIPVIAADVEAEVKFNLDEDHYVYLKLRSRDAEPAPYRFSVTVIASFEFDLEIARAEYKPASTSALVQMITVNVARIVFSGAREFLAMMTSRSTYGAAVLDSVLLEPRDLKIVPDPEPMVVLSQLFKAPDDELKAIEARMQERRAAKEAAAAQSAPAKKGARRRTVAP